MKRLLDPQYSEFDKEEAPFQAVTPGVARGVA
jgi:hypothetical protein